MEQIYQNKYNIYNPLFYNVYYGVIGKRCFTARWRCVSYMEIAPPLHSLHLWPARLISRSRNRSSTLQSESGNRTYIITASRMTSGLVLKQRNGECFVIRHGCKVDLPASRKSNLTEPYALLIPFEIKSYINLIL